MKTVEKRNYQTQCLNKLKKHRKDGNKKALIAIATGLGKTYIAVKDVKAFMKETGKANPRVLFCAHIKDILEEAKDEFARQLPKLEVDFKTIQSLVNNLSDYARSYYDYIIFDEAHHSKAETHEKVVKYFRPKFKLGLTATPHRADGLEIEDLFGDAIYSMGLPDGLAKGYLAELDYQVVFDQSIREAIMKDFNPTSVIELRKLLNVKPRNKEIVKNILEEKARLKLKNAQTIVFCQGIEHAKEMASLLNGKAYYSNLGRLEKDRIFNDFRAGVLETICTVDMFNEGVNIPEARLLVFLRSTASRTIFLQQLGRGLRKTISKGKVSVLDFAANIERLENIELLVEQIDSIQSSSDTLGKDTSPSKFRYYNFEFSKHVMEVISKLHLLTETIPPDYITIGEIADKYSLNKTTVSGMCVKTNIVVKKFKNRVTKGAGNGGDINAISLHDFRKLKSKYAVFFAPTYIKNSGVYTIKDLSVMFNIKENVMAHRLRILGIDKSIVNVSSSGSGRKATLSINEAGLKKYKDAYPDLEFDPKGYVSYDRAFKTLADKYKLPTRVVKRCVKDDVDVSRLSEFYFSGMGGARTFTRSRGFSEGQLEKLDRLFVKNYVEDFANKDVRPNKDRKQLPGVTKTKTKKAVSYEAYTRLNLQRGLKPYLGTFKTAEAANRAYVDARRDFIKWKLGVK